MSQKSQGDKPPGRPPVPPPPRRHRPSVPPPASPSDVTSIPSLVAKRTEPRTTPEPTSGKGPRSATPSLIDPVVRTPRKSTGASGKAVQDSSRLSTRRSSMPEAGPPVISSQMSEFTATPEAKATPKPKIAFREAGPSVISSQETPPIIDYLKAPGAKATSKRISFRGAPDPPSVVAEKILSDTGRRSSSSSPVKASGPVASSQETIRDTGPSTSAPIPEASRRASLKSSLTQKTTDVRSRSPRVTHQEAVPSTSAGGIPMGLISKNSKILKKGSKEPGRKTSIGGTNRAKANRILYTSDEDVRNALIEFTVFIIFLILTSLVALSVRHSYMFYFNDTMKKLFTSRDLVIAPSVTVNFEKQITVPDWWDYLTYNFLITLHGDLTLIDGSSEKNSTDTDNNTSEPTPQPGEKDESLDEDERRKRAASNSGFNWGSGVPEWRKGEARRPVHRGNQTSNITVNHLEGRIFLYENLLLGPPRIRQIRVQKESCYVNDAFIRYFNSCYAAYSRAAEQKSVFQGLQYQTMSQLDTMPLWTVLAFYRTGGYVIDLTYEKDENLATITKLKNNHWLDRGSRLCLVEFNLLNDNTDIFQSIKLMAEIPPTGGVIPQAHLQTVKQHTFFTDRNIVNSVIYIFWYIMVVYYTIYEITEIRKAGFKNYLFSIINMLDCIILLLCYLALVYNIWHTFKVNSVTERATVELSYQSLDVLCFWNIIYVDMMAILAFLVWIKIFKFISFNKTLVQFTTTLKRCSKDLAGFSLMFGIVFLAYAQLGLLLFGTKHPDFRNFITSILTMIRMILGDFQYNLIEQANRVLGPIYFLTYILLVFFILLNMFLAIIMETYNTVKSEITHGTSHLGSYIYRKAIGILYVIIHCGRKRRSVQQPTDEGAEQEAKVAQEEPEEMTTNLTATQARYFQDIPPEENKEMTRLTNRVSLLEEILEKLVTNMDDILKRVEKERYHRMTDA